MSKYYETGKIWALKDLSFNFQPSKFYIVAGESGSGKTTLLNILSSIDKPTKGEVIVEGINISKEKENQLAKWRLENVGIIFQFYHLIPFLTGFENIMLPMNYCKKFEKANIKKRALELLKLCNASHLKNKYPNEMSGGEMQRVAVARALANNPKYLFADEPTGNLDERNKRLIWGILKKVNNEYGITVVVATHNTQFFVYGDKIIFLKDGKIIKRDKNESIS